MNAVVRTTLLILILGIPLSAYVPRRVASPAGLVLERWADSSFPIVWRLNPAVQGSNVSGGRSLAEVFRSSFQAWSSVATARISFEEGAASAVTNAALDQVNLISVVPTQYGSDALSLTVIYSCTGSGADSAACAGKFPGQILEADILFNPAVTFSTDVSTPVSAIDLESRAIHEIGHLLGLDHSGLLSAVMFPAIPAGANHLRVLGSDDVIGISTM